MRGIFKRGNGEGQDTIKGREEHGRGMPKMGKQDWHVVKMEKGKKGGKI